MPNDNDEIDALTLEPVANREDVWGRTRIRVYDVTFSAGYPTGGYTISPAIVGLTHLQGIHMIGGATGAISYLIFFNTSTGLLQVIDNTTGVEEMAETPLDRITLRLLFLGE